MLYFYIVASAALVLIFNNFFEIFKQPYSFWLVPLLLIGFFVAFIIIQFLFSESNQYYDSTLKAKKLLNDAKNGKKSNHVQVFSS